MNKNKFWSTQPVIQNELSEINNDGPIDSLKSIDDIRKIPYCLPPEFEWIDIDLTNNIEAESVYKLLIDNYVENDTATFRLNYSVNFLRWALLSPNYFKDWHIGVRVIKTKKLVAFIAGIPVKISVNHNDIIIKMCEINFLCVHKKLRLHRLAPVLIKEVTRRVNLREQWQAIYTSGTLIPTPIGNSQYWLRFLNPKKLVDIGFINIPRNTHMINYYSLPDSLTILGIREMIDKDVPQVTQLLNNYLKKYKLFTYFNEEEVNHWFIPRNNVIATFVVENNNIITDLISFYHLPLLSKNYEVLNSVYSFYNVNTKHTLKELYYNALILAKKCDSDVFNSLDIMENKSCFNELKFKAGDGYLHYYLYNWKTNKMNSNEIGFVLK